MIADGAAMASALRFIMQGEGADTTVNGEMYQINEGDLVLTADRIDARSRAQPMVWIEEAFTVSPASFYTNDITVAPRDGGSEVTWHA
ncbi:cupin domain-containing protein [Paracoccus mutanolyticus]|uniref:hypothetical protein n=1 Tax=Paracoccus mutanolyticus TaxID=1499308 RepID=UPI0021D5229E|nr:hypothetical protein [Paracoccus mutanolyticus]